MKLEEFDYDLPQELIAQVPSQQRDHCRLMVLNREKGTIENRHFYDIKEYLKPGDCLVLNDSRVIPARLFGRKAPRGTHRVFADQENSGRPLGSYGSSRKASQRRRCGGFRQGSTSVR